LVDELRILAQGPVDHETILQAIDFLGPLSIIQLSGTDEHAQVLVPCSDNQFYPQPNVYYNDLGDRIALVQRLNDEDSLKLAHNKLTWELADKLRIPRLSLSDYKPLDEDEPEIGEPLTTRIRNVLLQYAPEQMFGEFVSNAVDAKASRIEIVLDEKSFPSEEIIAGLEQFQSQHAIIIYNDATFKDKDFRGIRDVGTGGKRGNLCSIGQFGLGALSMYHFAEVR
jgi:hypothetical protein